MFGLRNVFGIPRSTNSFELNYFPVPLEHMIFVIHIEVL
jgi:hypothetical protein